MELANTCNEGDKSSAKCFVQLQVRCELTQDVEVQWEGGRVDVERAAGEDGSRVCVCVGRGVVCSGGSKER